MRVYLNFCEKFHLCILNFPLMIVNLITFSHYLYYELILKKKKKL